MSFSVFEIVIPSMIQATQAVHRYLKRAREWEPLNALADQSILDARLAPDMLSLAEQFNIFAVKTERVVARLRKEDVPSEGQAALTFDEIEERLAALRNLLDDVKPEDIDSADTHSYYLKSTAFDGYFNGNDYIRHIAIPDMFFHVATIHAILRSRGVAIGKRDYLGNVLQKVAGDYS